MLNIIKNVGKILLKRKSYMFVSLVLPIVLTFLFTLMYSSNSVYRIGVINKDNDILGTEIEKRLESINAVEVVQLNEDENNVQKLVFSEISMIVTIDENYTENLINGEKGEIRYKSISQDEMKIIITQILESETKSLATICNNISVSDLGIDNVISTYNDSTPNYEVINNKDVKVRIDYSVGLIVYLIFMSAAITGSFLLEDEREGTKDRILMGKTGEKSYYGGMCGIFFILSSVPALEYYIVCKVFGYEIGFENDILLLVLLLLIVLLAVVFNVMLSSLIKNKVIFTTASGTLTIPIFMLSGAFWPYDIMGKELQKIGNILPPRWFLLSIEKLQQGGDIITILPMIIGLVIVIILLFLLSVFFTRNKIVLIKGNN